MVSLTSIGKVLLLATALVGYVNAGVYTCVIDEDATSCQSLNGNPPAQLLCDTATPCDQTVNNQWVCNPAAYDLPYRVPVQGVSWTNVWQNVCMAMPQNLGEVWGKLGTPLHCVSLGNCRGCSFDMQRNFHVCKDWVPSPNNPWDVYSINCEFSLTDCDSPPPDEGPGGP